MKTYRMTDEELEKIIEASKPVTYMVFGGVEPLSPREKAMAVWNQVASRVGCRVDSIGPASTGDDHDFVAQPVLPD